MKRTVLAPELSDLDADELETTVSSVGELTHRDGYRKVTLSGLVRPEGGLESQTRTLLEHVAEIVCDDLDGSMDDVTMTRWYVREAALTAENRTRMHEIRATFFDLPHYPLDGCRSGRPRRRGRAGRTRSRSRDSRRRVGNRRFPRRRADVTRVSGR